MPIQLIKRFLQLESAGGIILFLTAILAMMWANSSVSYIHQLFIQRFLFLINDGLMALFFLVVGLELKRSYLNGQLSSKSQILLPLLSALGGMLIPALIYVAVNFYHPETRHAWATPTATDIAFVLGVLSLFGQRVPLGLKIFLLALAIFDDIGAIIIIVLYYSHGLSWLYLGLSCCVLLMLLLLNKASVRLVTPYVLLGMLLWFTLLHAGIHPTLAGVALAFCIPGTPPFNSPLERVENSLHPWVAYLVMPLFALANAGFPLQAITWHTFTSPVTLGIIAGLFFGKQIGVFLFSWLVIVLGWAKLPENCSWPQLYAGALLCGIGFTMSLFLGTLSFPNQSSFITEVRLGVMIGSFLSGLIGAIVLLFTVVPYNRFHTD
jgi:NhaA family Na+:H+ antiporter